MLPPLDKVFGMIARPDLRSLHLYTGWCGIIIYKIPQKLKVEFTNKTSILAGGSDIKLNKHM